MLASAEVVRLSEWTPARSPATSRPILRVFELRHHTLSALGDLLKGHDCHPRERHRAQIAEVLLELKRRQWRLVCAMDDLAAFGGDDIWQQSPFREPFNELAQTTAAHITLLIREAQMIAA